ncbi:MAG: hypothetical protein CL568_04260 [Alphaproteobacteria bacterium]|nr:hypothetical protein [Alphaproteobacteria bacterium]PPR14387.1 MAG: Chromosome partition protein Smc [Alphaproteobacteria bacterium MarineAlpha12_Bin1]
MDFKKLKLKGFKSFVDGTELDIAEGLTGVVGPNGCGKSNLVEGLRWVMGETSAKQMRGSGMDDIIFGGTSDRPARNVAEVILSLDNSDRKAPSQFNDGDELEISRHIEREKGSTYRVNGREVRARDVQILFADQTTGARSTALVSQGRIGAIINAKPADRRLIIEEAAGITGLYTRRHEAELRLRAAETNLERLDDILLTLNDQLKSLKKQTRQARRYRNISQDIRKTEAIVFHNHWIESISQVELKKNDLMQCDLDVAQKGKDVSKANIEKENLADEVSPLRDDQILKAAELHRLELESKELETKEERVKTSIELWTKRRDQISSDLTREQELVSESQSALLRLSEERKTISKASNDDPKKIESANNLYKKLYQKALEKENSLAEALEKVATREAGLVASDLELKKLDDRKKHRKLQLEALNDQIAELSEKSSDAVEFEKSENNIKEIDQLLVIERDKLDKTEQKRIKLGFDKDSLQKNLSNKEETLSQLKIEASTLKEILNDGLNENKIWTPILDEIEVATGYELAISAAFGDDLEASLDEEAPRRWVLFPDFVEQPGLPNETAPLAPLISKAGPLSRRLKQVGIVKDVETGNRLAHQLKIGQRLVDTKGNLWRWDGYFSNADSKTVTSTLIGQRNRLREIEEKIPEAVQNVRKAERQLLEITSSLSDIYDDEKFLRDKVRNLDNEVTKLHKSNNELLRELTTRRLKRENLISSSYHFANELEEITESIKEANSRRAAFSEIGELRQDASQKKSVHNEARNKLQSAKDELSQLIHESDERQRRINAITAEEKSFSDRSASAANRIAELQNRDSDAVRELKVLSNKPNEIKAERSLMIDSIEKLEKERRNSADKLAIAENKLSESEVLLRKLESKFIEAREKKIRSESLIEQAEKELKTIVERILEQLKCEPKDLIKIAELPENRPIPDLELAEKRLQRLLRERDNMGPVNLRAEQETKDMEDKISAIESERKDLTSAILRLRQGISNLNREARARLLRSFDEVNLHFKKLFSRLFGGGKAHLALTEASDPLQAGLEIFASPPGKKLQNLSLLSGGEQALTAISLLFAVFLTNPAPICVLDEVDAALDDANVDRFCSLLGEIASTSNTRFLVITHHRMTMSRMDRLYGVTMPEQGISQLVSVNLSRAEQMRATA